MFDINKMVENWNQGGREMCYAIQKGYFFVLLFLLFDVPALSSACHGINARLMQLVQVHTFRFVPFPSDLLFAPDFVLSSFAFFGDVFGFTEKKPSRRPCCFAFRNFVSFSAPLRTLSSLEARQSMAV